MLDRKSCSTAEAMAALGTKKSTFWKQVKARAIEVIRIGGKTVVPTENLDQLVANLRQKAAANSPSTVPENLEIKAPIPKACRKQRLGSREPAKQKTKNLVECSKVEK